MFCKTFTSSSNKKSISVFDSSVVDSILKIQNINSSESLWKGHIHLPALTQIACPLK